MTGLPNYQKLEEIQKQAYNSWLTNDKKSILEITTGMGKTWIAFMAMLAEEPGAEVLFLSERTNRQHTVLAEVEKYRRLKGIDILSHIKINFECYQTAYRWKNKKFGLVIADEVHEIGEEYIKFFLNNQIDRVLGLSATINERGEYSVGNKRYNKKGLLEHFIGKISYKYTIEDAARDGLSREAIIYVYKHELDFSKKNIKITDTFSQSEGHSYKYWDNKYNDLYEAANRENRFLTKAEKLSAKKIALMRAKQLYQLPSKISVVRSILRKLKGQSIVFGNNIEFLKQLTPNVVSHKTKRKNPKIMEAFNNQQIDTIGSFKMLQQGENFTKLDNCILASYSSADGELAQRIGRLRRADNVAKIVIIMTQSTKEETWIENILEGLNSYEIRYITDINEIK